MMPIRGGPAQKGYLFSDFGFYVQSKDFVS